MAAASTPTAWAGPRQRAASSAGRIRDVPGDRLAAVAGLPCDDLAALLNIIDGLVAKNRLKTLAGGLS
jgi:hypothetical protein